MSVRAALVGRAGPLGLGALLAGFGWLACGRVELGSQAEPGGPTASDMSGSAERAGRAAGAGNVEDAPRVLLGEPGSAPTSSAGGAPVDVFGAATDGESAGTGGSVDSDTILPREADAGDDAGNNAGDDAGAALSSELIIQSGARRPSCRLQGLSVRASAWTFGW